MIIYYYNSNNMYSPVSFIDHIYTNHPFVMDHLVANIKYP